MDSVDPGAYLTSLMGQQPQTQAPVGNIDSQIMALLKQSGTAGIVPSEASQNTAIAKQVTPQGSNRLMTWLKNAPAAAGGEFTRLGMGLAGKKMDPLMQSVFDQAKNASPGVAPATDVLATAPIAMSASEALPAAAARFGIPALGRLAASAPGMGAVQGALQGALTADPGQRLQQGLIGAGAGAALPLLGSGIGKLAKGLTRTPEAQNLVSQGVQLPMGMLNPTGPVNKLEQAFSHLPLVGSKIANARAAVPAQVTERMVQDAVAPGAMLPPGISSDLNSAVAELKNGYDMAYHSAIGGYPGSAVIMRTTGPDIALQQAFTSITNKARPGLTAQARTGLGQTLQDQLQEVINAARQSGQGIQLTDLQQFRSTLRTLGREAPEGTTQSAVRDFWQDAEGKVTQAIESQLPPKSAAALRSIDQNYGNYTTVRNLAVAVKDRTPTMNDWSNAIKQATPPNVYAAGGGWNRDLIKNAAGVVKSTVPATGATGAGIITPAVHGLEAGGAALLAAHNPAAAAGLGLGLGGLYGAYSGPGMRTLAGQTGAQKYLQGLMGGINPQLGRAGSLAARSALIQGLLGAPSIQAATQ